MKSGFSIALFALSLAGLTTAEDAESVLRFSNNDHLSGKLDALTLDRIVWNSPILEKPASFLLEKILDVTLPANPLEEDARHEASITLTNGDVVRGQLAAVSDEAVELDTWYADRLRFNRLMISDIRIAEKPDLIYRGPSGLEGWKQSGEKPVWIYQNSSLLSNGAGSIAREMKLPDQCSVAFDVSWRNNLSLRVVVHSDELASDRPSAGYDMNFQSRSVSLRSSKGQRYIGQSPNVTALQENEKAHIEIRASSRSGKVSLYIDGELIENWVDGDLAQSAFGKGIHFISQTSSPVRISRIQVAAWDGETEQLPDARIRAANMGFGEGMDEEPAPVPVKAEGDGRMELRNGDSIVGEVLGIADGLIHVKTPFREVNLPIEALRSLALKPVDLERCIRKNGDVRAYFPDGSAIVFRLDAVGEGTVTGFSQNFGTATFKVSAFNRIEFNIYNIDLDSVRIANGL